MSDTDKSPAEMGEQLDNPKNPGSDTDYKVGQLLSNRGMEIKQMKASHITRSEYRILSVRNGNVTVREVNLKDMSCTCEDYQFNRDHSQDEICAHIAKAMLVHPSHFDAAEWAVRDLQHCVSQAHDAAMRMEDTAASMSRARSDHAHEAAESSQREMHEAAGGPESESKSYSTDELVELAEKIEDNTRHVQTDVSDGVIWVQLMRESPDWAFDAFIREPESIAYDPDNDYHDSPGQWWKNYVKPDDVDDYINEVS